MSEKLSVPADAKDERGSKRRLRSIKRGEGQPKRRTPLRRGRRTKSTRPA